MNWLPALGLAVAVGAPITKEAPKKAEPPPIVGEWTCVAFVGGGRIATPDEVKELQFRLEFTADGKFRHNWGPRSEQGTYTIDPAKEPAHVDYSVPGKVGNQGIYKVDKDMLTLCAAEGGGPRPDKFESPAGTRIMLLTFQRVEKKKD
jgi:uncharacterized protein (TIGR03067 family)